MKYFLVYQNQTFRYQSKGGFLWSPQKAESGFSVHHWPRMKETEPGNLIFIIVQQKVDSVNQSGTNECHLCREASRNTDEKHVGQEGYLVNAEYHLLQEPFSVRENIKEMLPLAQYKYSSFTSTGGSDNQEYLYSIPDELEDYLLRGIQEGNNLRLPESSTIKSSTKEKKV